MARGIVKRKGLPRSPAAWALGLLAALGALSLSSCYVTVQGSRYLALRARAVGAERVLSDPVAPESSKDLLRRAESIRVFAVETLGLKDTRNYRSLVQTDADSLATVVSACGSDSFERHLWNYPVVGALPYKGFFKPEEAEKEAARLKAEGLDVILRPVDAFSTLGWFSDPLFSFMSKYSDGELAETIIHELAHATVFVKKAEQFNEEFATFVGRQGAMAYLAARYGPDSPQTVALERFRRDAEAFAAFLRGTADRLEAVYASKTGREEKLARKAAVIEARAREYRDTVAPSLSGEAYRDFPMEKINNAYLDLYRLYEGEPELYRDFFEGPCGGDLSEFVSRVRDLASRGGDPKEGMRELLPPDEGD